MKREEMARGTGGTGAEGLSRPTGKRGSILRGPITAAAGSLAAFLRGNGNASDAMAKDPVSSWGKDSLPPLPKGRGTNRRLVEGFRAG